MKPVLGISVYPDISPMSEIKKYFALASKYGFTRVFSSMFSVVGTNEEVLAYFREMDEAAHEYGLRVSLDVNPPFLKRLGASPEDLSVFDSIHCDIIRMDGSYGFDDEIKLLNNPYGIQIEFNASSKSCEQILALAAAGVDKDRMLFCHNFYPQRYTGFKWQKFLDTNAEVAKAEVRMGAFVSSNAPNTHGVWDAVDGLPTVEKMRGLPIDLQTRIMLATGNVTDIFIGNAYASEEELCAMQKAAEGKQVPEDNPFIQRLKAYVEARPDMRVILLKVVFDKDATPEEKEALLNFVPHIDFGDSSEWIWRSRGPRSYYQHLSYPYRDIGKEYFDVYDVLEVNDNYKHYAPEVQIVRIPLKNDGQRNRVAHLAPGEEMLFELVRDGDIIMFEEA